MPPLVDVLPPSEDFTSLCIDGLPPADDAVPPPAEDTTEGGETGFLIDPAVSGVAYETPTHRGVTGPDGGFRYENGETIRFSLGDITLGEVAGQAQVTPFDLAGASVPVGMRDITAALEDDDHPFQAVINTAVLLQSLDRDADPDNGLEITPEVAALFAGVSLDLNRPWREFRDQFWLNHAMAQANARGFFSTVHGVVNPARALQQLYATLGIDAGTMGLSLEESVWEGSAGDRVEYQYDAGGNLTRVERSEATGEVREAESWTWDANGNRATYERELFGRESTERWQYNAQGNLTQLVIDDDGDGESVTTVDFEYGADGRTVKIAFNGNRLDEIAGQLGIPAITHLAAANTYLVTYQYDADGTPTGDILDGFNADLGRNVVTRTYDDRGNVIRSEGRLERFDSPQPVEITISEYQYEYDGDGRVIRESADEDGDGRTDRVTSFEYDASGRVIRQVTEEGTSGDRAITSYAYDDNGNVTQEVFDEDGDGEADEITNREYDQQGNLVRLEQDYDADGTPDSVESWPYQYEYDAQGDLARRVLDQNGDGRPDEIVDYAYYNNRQLAREDHWSTEGAEYESSTWRYDASGKLTREEWDDGADGVADRITRYTYDACGNLQDRLVRREGGTPGTAEHWRYDAQGHLRRHEWTNMPFIDGLPEDLVDIFQSTGFESWQYDVHGRLTRYQGECEGGGCSFDYYHFVNQIVNYEYDDAGSLARELVDRDRDGRPDRVTVNEYDTLGNVTRNLLDEDGDGSADYVVSYEYDAAGNVTREMRDEGGDGRFGVINYSYDADNRLTRREDTGADGKLNSIETLEYDARGNLLRQASEAGDDGHEYDISVHTYDAMGNRTRTEEDGNGDGVVDTIRFWEYDADGNLVREGVDEEADQADFFHSYQYDADGNLVGESEGRDLDGDGIPDEGETRYYVPTGWGHLFAN